MYSEANGTGRLRIDNPLQLVHLDAIYVTVEQRPQTEKSTGVPFFLRCGGSRTTESNDKVRSSASGRVLVSAMPIRMGDGM